MIEVIATSVAGMAVGLAVGIVVTDEIKRRKRKRRREYILSLLDAAKRAGGNTETAKMFRRVAYDMIEEDNRERGRHRQ